MRNLHTLAKKKHVIGIKGIKFLKDHLCGACEAGKITTLQESATLPSATAGGKGMDGGPANTFAVSRGRQKVTAK